MQQSLPYVKGMMLLGAAIALTLAPFQAAHAQELVNSSPVVQLVSYKGIVGKYYSMYGWGSASVIDKQGHIISNNHVVDDGTGKLATDFNVCVTKVEKERPRCDYTASLIARDDTMDVSVLQIDPVDIYGNKVDYAAFKTIDIDFSYTPTVQDEAILIGYPWVGADTITQTKGIVSGLAQINGHQYIKTDATIAGGNSGGAMINKEGKLIGIPTYSIGGFFDASLGYGLHIKEAESFITESVQKTAQINADKDSFVAYRKTLDTLNKTMKVQDDLLTMMLPEGYEVKEYVKNRYLQIASKSLDDTAMDIGVRLVSIPAITTEEELFYFGAQKGVYRDDPETFKVVKKTIGGIEFYTQVSKYDVTDGKVPFYREYFAQLSPTLLLTVYTSSSISESTIEKQQAVVQDLLGRFTFSKEHVEKLMADMIFDLAHPALRVEDPSIVKNEMDGHFALYLGNLHEYADFFLEPQYLFSGSKSTPEEIYNAETANVPDASKAMISYMGRKGYVMCEEYYPYGSSEDERGYPLPEQQRCVVKVLEGFSDMDGLKYTLVMELITNKVNAKSNLEKVYEAMTTKIIVPIVAEGKTDLVMIFDQLPKLLFRDLADQQQEWTKMVQYLVKYGIVSNKRTFSPYYAMKWKDVLPIYLKAVYGVNLAKDASKCLPDDKVCLLHTAVSDLGGKKVVWKDIIEKKLAVDLEAYVPTNKYYGKFKDLLDITLAEVTLPSYSEAQIDDFMKNRQEKRYETENQKYEDFLYAVHGGSKTSLSELLSGNMASFDAKKSAFFVPGKGLYYREHYEETPYTLSIKDDVTYPWYGGLEQALQERRKANVATFVTCSTRMPSPACITEYVQEEGRISQEEYALYMQSYDVLTKGDFISDIANSINVSFFDPKIKAQKETSVE